MRAPPATLPATGPKAAIRGARPRLVFVATEDWFFASHFLPMARAAREAGFEPVVVARVRAHAGAIEAAGARLVPLEAERGSFSPLAIASAARRLAAILAHEEPAIVHAVALRAILLAGVACRLTGVRRRVWAVTGLGLLGARRDAAGRIARGLVRVALRGPLGGGDTCFLFENPDDPRLLGLDPADARVVIVGGAGVDPAAFAPSPLPPGPLRVALVSRMLWSKGPDLAVEAVRLARARGADVSLTLVGAPDPDNPRAIPEACLREWAAQPGIAWAGRREDIAAVWREHGAALVPSRGGEGLPRALLEAAACGRAIVATDVPGCRHFVRDGIEGLLAPPEDAAALGEALARLAADPARVKAMGEAARARLLAGFTERHVQDGVAALWRAMLQRPDIEEPRA